jgi:predicted negative regulator of RcsB-dependent stress response
LQLWLLLLLSFTSLFALELSVQTGKEEMQEYSILHLRDQERFFCEAQRDDMKRVTSVICAFKKRPMKPIATIENNFFSISSQLKDKTFFIIVKPVQKISLRSDLFDFIKDDETFEVNDDYSRHWLILGYKENEPLIKPIEYNTKRINFPIPHADNPYPFIGGLDMLGNPIKMSRVKDVSDYLAIKKHYKAGRYDTALALIDEVFEEYPDTIFKSELMLYQIRCYHEKDEAENLIEVSKRFIRNYSSDVNIAEVLADTANAYSKIALFTDADYFFDRLFDEHKESPFAHLGLVYKAQQLESAGNSSKAMEYYERALREAKERNTASLAAYRIVLMALEQGKTKKAVTYAQKIVNGNRDYFISKRQSSIDMALNFASRTQFKIAADIAGALLDNMTRSDDYYEELLRNRGVWLAETEAKEEALEVFNSYLERYKYGIFSDEIKREKDALFFDVSDENTTAKLEHFNLLMNKYEGDTIAQRAIYEKAMLLSQLNRHADVLAMEYELRDLDPALYPEAETLITQAALGMMQDALKENACIEVVDLSNNYDINLSSEWDSELFGCYLAAGNFESAKNIAQDYIKSKDYDERLIWLERYVNIDFSLGNYTAVIDALKELVSLKEQSENLKNYRLMFDAAQRLGEKETMLEAISQIETISGLSFDDIERYAQMVTLAKDDSDSIMLENFAKKVMTLQDRTNSYSQTPYIEFTLAQALIENQKNSEALDVVFTLDDRNLTDAKRARQKYLLGTLYQKNSQNDLAKKAYEASVNVDTNSSWAKLASDALELIP